MHITAVLTFLTKQLTRCVVIKMNKAFNSWAGMFGYSKEILGNENLRNTILENTANKAIRGAMIGAGVGATSSLIDGNPNTGVLGGALKGGLAGGLVGGVGGFVHPLGMQARMAEMTSLYSQDKNIFGATAGWTGFSHNKEGLVTGRSLMSKLFGQDIPKEELAQDIHNYNEAFTASKL